MGWHGYYDSYCYLPLYIFAGDQLLRARLRAANKDAAAGSVEEVTRIITQLRARWPQVRIILRADSGFCREELMAWCEAHRVGYAFGLARNKRLQKIIGAQMHQARVLHQATGKAARVFTEFAYQTRKSWSRARRVVAIAEPELVYPETTAFKSTRPSGSGDPEQNSTGHSYSGSALSASISIKAKTRASW